jgi:hypothetical protein
MFFLNTVDGGGFAVIWGWKIYFYLIWENITP